MNIALFSGSFDPYTIGHHDILTRFLPLFDKIVIGVGYNERKHGFLSADERVSQIAEVYRDESKVEVQKYTGLTVDYARQISSNFIIKGVRSMKDFEYEREQAEINKLLAPEIETILLFASSDKVAISSSMVRELKHFGRDVSEFLP